MTEDEMRARVICQKKEGETEGRCRCTYTFPFVDDYGCCTDEFEEPDKPDKEPCQDGDISSDCPEKTCLNTKCGDCQVCINPFGKPMCVCDKEAGCVGNGKHCWLADDMTCSAETFGTCGVKGADFPVPMGSPCMGALEEDGEEGTDEEFSFNTICGKPKTTDDKPDKPDKPVKPTKPPGKNAQADKPEKPDRPTQDKPKYGCCQCAPGFEDADGDASNGCESKINPCDAGRNKCSADATCTMLEVEEEEETCDCKPEDPECTCMPEEECEGEDCKPDKPECPEGEDCKPECPEGETCKPDKPVKPVKPVPIGDDIWEQLGYKCECNDGFTGNGFKCKTSLQGCDRFGDKCGKNATCHDIDVKPFIACKCDPGFTGSPPKEQCKPMEDSLEVTSGPGESNSCDQIDYTAFKIGKSTLKAERATLQGDDQKTLLTFTHGKVDGAVPKLNNMKYSALIEFTEPVCGAEFIAGVASGDVTINILDTPSDSPDHGPLYSMVVSRGFFLNEQSGMLLCLIFIE